MNLEEIPGAVRQVIADAERYKRERDEAVGLLVKWIGPNSFWKKDENGQEVLCYWPNDVPRGESMGFVSRIRQLDEVSHDPPH